MLLEGEDVLLLFGTAQSRELRGVDAELRHELFVRRRTSLPGPIPAFLLPQALAGGACRLQAH